MRFCSAHSPARSREARVAAQTDSPEPPHWVDSTGGGSGASHSSSTLKPVSLGKAQRAILIGMQPPPYQPPPYSPPAPPATFPTGYATGSGKPSKSWLGRNMGCAIGLGCLAILAFICLMFLGVFAVAMTAMKASDVYSVAMHAATTDKTLISELGAPIKAGWFVSGSVNVAGSTGDANISIPVSGSFRAGHVNAVAKKAAGKWIFSVLNAEVEGRAAPIDLLPRLPP